MRFTAGRDPQTTSSGCSHGAVSPCQYQTRCSTRKVRIPTEGAKDSQLELGPQPLCSDGLLFLVSLAKRLLTTARGIHTGKGQEIDHPKLCGVPSGIGSAPPKSKKVCHPIKRLGALAKPRRSMRSGLLSARGIKDHTEERLSIITVEIRDARSKVIPWSRNWPRNVTPAV